MAHNSKLFHERQREIALENERLSLSLFLIHTRKLNALTPRESSGTGKPRSKDSQPCLHSNQARRRAAQRQIEHENAMQEKRIRSVKSTLPRISPPLGPLTHRPHHLLSHTGVLDKPGTMSSTGSVAAHHPTPPATSRISPRMLEKLVAFGSTGGGGSGIQHYLPFPIHSAQRGNSGTILPPVSKNHAMRAAVQQQPNPPSENREVKNSRGEKMKENQQMDEQEANDEEHADVDISD